MANVLQGLRVDAFVQVLGWEGFWGTVGMALVGMPLAWIIPGTDIGVRL